MTSLQISRLEVHVSAPVFPALLIARLEVHATKQSSALQISRLEVHTTKAATALKVSRVEVRSAAKPSAGVDQDSIEPGESFVLTGTGGAGGTGVWTQISGPTARLLSTVGAVATYQMPGAPAPGAVCVFRYTVQGASDDVVVSGLRSTTLRWDGAKWIGQVELPKSQL